MKKSAFARTQTFTLFIARMKRYAILFAFLLCVPMFAFAAEQPYISEVAWAGSAASTSDEWFEICGAAGTDLSNWVIEGASVNGILLPEGSVIPNSGAFIVSNYGSEDAKSTLDISPGFVTTGVALSNSQLFLILRDASGNAIDTAGASGTPPYAGTSGSNKVSMTRLLPIQDGGSSEAWASASTSSGFDADATELGTPGTCPTVAVEVVAEEVSEPIAPIEAVETISTPRSAVQPPATAVRISELYPSPLSGEQEWIELVNPSSIGEVLDGWTIEDGKGTATRLASILLPWERLVIASPKGTLNNAGDLVILKDAQGRIIDGVAYGDWDTALYPRVGSVSKGEAVIRLELQETFDRTVTPTPGTANILKRETIPEAPAENTVMTAEVVVPVRASAPAPVAIAAEKEHVPKPAAVPQLASTAATKPTTTPVKKVAASRYKGDSYTATIAVPPGVYSKTRMYVLRNDDLEEVRLSKSTTRTYLSGQRISFVAQSKDENGASFLLTNPNSIGRIGAAASNTFATVDRWPTEAGGYRFTAEFVAPRAGGAEVRLDTVEGDVLLPKSASALKPGDRLEIQGFVSPGARPRVVVPDAASFRLLEAAPVESTTYGAPRPRLPWLYTAALTAAAGVAGLFGYLRSERLKRLALVTQPFEEDFS